MLHRNIPLCYVMWNLFTVGSLQFPHDTTIASLEANPWQSSFAKWLFPNSERREDQVENPIRSRNKLKLDKLKTLDCSWQKNFD